MSEIDHLEIERNCEIERFTYLFAFICEKEGDYIDIILQMLNDDRLDCSLIENEDMIRIVKANNVKIVELLLKRNLLTDNINIEYLISVAYENSFTSMTSLLVNYTEKSDIFKTHIILGSIINDDMNILEEFLKTSYFPISIWKEFLIQTLLTDNLSFNIFMNHAKVSSDDDGKVLMANANRILASENEININFRFNSIFVRLCWDGNVEVVKKFLLLDDLDCSTPKGKYSPLCIATRKNHIEIVKLLLEDDRVVFLNEINNVINYSIKKGHVEICKMILDKSENIFDSNDHSILLSYAVSYNQIEIVKLFLKKGDPSFKRNFPLRKASSKGYVDIVELLLSDGRVNPSDLNNSSIIKACSKGHTDIVELLLKDTRTNPAVDNNVCIVEAAKHNHLDIVKLLLLDERVDAGTKNGKILPILVSTCSLELMEVLLIRTKFDLVAINAAIREAFNHNRPRAATLLIDYLCKCQK